MLPILRILSVGGVLLAILILVLALKTPEPRVLPPHVMAARGALIDRDDHPEWRQFLIQAALRRADELNRLRDLPDAPVHVTPILHEIDVESGKVAGDATTKVAGLPSTRGDADPDPEDVTGSTEATHTATIPVDIGETSTFELPVTLPEERPSVIRAPERAKPANESRNKPVRKVRRAKATQARPAQTTQLPPPFNLLELLFSSSSTTAPRTKTAAPPQVRAGLN